MPVIFLKLYPVLKYTLTSCGVILAPLVVIRFRYYNKSLALSQSVIL